MNKIRFMINGLLGGWLLLFVPLVAQGYFREEGDTPNPSILTNPPDNAKVFLIIFYIIAAVAVFILLALAGWGFRNWRENR